jgi:ankyrin repeat protein
MFSPLPISENLEKHLLDAVKRKTYPMVEVYIKEGAKGTASENGYRALHFAAREGDVKMLKLLLSKCLVNTCIFHPAAASSNLSYETPIVLAAHNGHWNFVMKFAEILQERKGEYDYGTALLIAIRKNHYLAVETLLRAGAARSYFDPKDTQLALKNAVTALLKTGTDMNSNNTGNKKADLQALLNAATASVKPAASCQM